MRRILFLLASAAINASAIPAVAAECTPKDIDASRARWELLRKQPGKAADKENICRAYAASFYESVTLRQVVAKCIDGERTLVTLDSEINAFNDLFASKCGN